MGIMTVDYARLSRPTGGLTEETGRNFWPSYDQMRPRVPKNSEYFVQEALMLEFSAHMIVTDDNCPQ